MRQPLPPIPWQITGNHWLTLPCIHPADASIHALGVVHARSRGAVEFAGGLGFLDGTAPPLARLVVTVNGERREVGAGGLAWEREFGWIPSFSWRMDDIALRGVICAPHGKSADVAGAVISVTLENRGNADMDIALHLEGTLGHRQVRVRSPRTFADGHSVSPGANASVVLEGSGAESVVAIAIGCEAESNAEGGVDGSGTWVLRQHVNLTAGSSAEAAFHLAAGTERDGAEAMLSVMRRRGARSLLTATRAALGAMEPSSGNAAADRLIARHVFFAYFCSVARALDDAHVYPVRSRIPWNGRGLTIRDWEALMWILPAVQLVDSSLARELLLRTCELHGYAPGAGVHYLDGAMFEPGFSLEGAAAYALAVDAYIVDSGDERVVEEPSLADALYGSREDIEARRNARFPLFATEVNPDGSLPPAEYTAHGNAVVALSLAILRNTLDEKTAEKLEDAAAVRAALLRHLATTGPDGKSVIAAAGDLEGQVSRDDQPSASLLWLPWYDLLARDDSTYRRTVRSLQPAHPEELVQRCARIVGPGTSDALEWLRRAPLDGGLAAEQVDEEGKAASNGGDAALSGLIAHAAWYAVHALGAKL